MIKEFEDLYFDDHNKSHSAVIYAVIAAALTVVVIAGVIMVTVARDWSWYFVSLMGVGTVFFALLGKLKRPRGHREPELLQAPRPNGSLIHSPVNDALVGKVGTKEMGGDTSPSTPNDGEFYVIASTRKHWVKLVWPLLLVAISVLVTVLVAWLESTSNPASLPIRIALLGALVIFAIVIPYLVSRYSARRWIDAWRMKKWAIMFRLIGGILLIGALVAFLTEYLHIDLWWVVDGVRWIGTRAFDLVVFVSQSTTVTATLFVAISVLTLAYQVMDYMINRICRESNGSPEEDRVVVEKGIILQSRPATPLSAIVDTVPEVFISLFNKGVPWCTIKVGTAEEAQAIDKIQWLPRSFLPELGIPDPVTAKYSKVRRVRVSRRRDSA